MLKILGTFLLKAIAKRGWETLNEKDINFILEKTIDDMSKEDKKYNLILGKNPILLKEIFNDEIVLEKMGNFLLNEEELVNNNNLIAILSKKIDNKIINEKLVNEIINDFQKYLLFNISLNPKIKDKFLVTAVFNLSKSQKQALEILTEQVEVVEPEETEGYTDVGGITQFRVLAYNFDKFMESLKKQLKLKSKSRFINVEKESDDKYMKRREEYFKTHPKFFDDLYDK